MKRTQMMLGGLLVLQVLLILLVRSPFSDASTRTEARPLLPELEAFTPTRLEILGDDEARVSLLKNENGWTLDQLGGYPADGEKVDKLLANLRELKVRRPVISSSRYHQALQVTSDDNEGRLRAFGESDDPKIDLILGSSPNYRMLHVRFAGEDPVYEVRGLAAHELRPQAEAWIRNQLVEIAADDMVGIEINNENGSFRLDRVDGVWKVQSPESLQDTVLDNGKVDALVRSATSIRLAEPVGPIDEQAHGLAAAAATVTLRFGAGASVPGASDEPVSSPTEQVVIRIGSTVADEDSQRYITSSGFGYTGTVWDSSITSLMEQKVQDLANSES